MHVDLTTSFLALSVSSICRCIPLSEDPPPGRVLFFFVFINCTVRTTRCRVSAFFFNLSSISFHPLRFLAFCSWPPPPTLPRPRGLYQEIIRALKHPSHLLWGAKAARHQMRVTAPSAVDQPGLAVHFNMPRPVGFHIAIFTLNFDPSISHYLVIHLVPARWAGW